MQWRRALANAEASVGSSSSQSESEYWWRRPAAISDPEGGHIYNQVRKEYQSAKTKNAIKASRRLHAAAELIYLATPLIHITLIKMYFFNFLKNYKYFNKVWTEIMGTINHQSHLVTHHNHHNQCQH